MSQVSDKPVRSDRHYSALDGLRGLAVLMVFFVHYGDLRQSSSSAIQFLGFIKGAGWMGVDLFFVLSGFLITGILFETAADPNYFKNFYMRRVLRLFPVFYGTAAVLLLLTPVLHIPWNWLHVAYLVYGANIVQIYRPDLALPRPFVLMHLWSLALEEQFYFIWPLVIYRIRDRKRLLWISFGMLVLSPLLRLVMLGLHVSVIVMYTQLPTRMDGFAVGGILALLLRKTEVRSLVPASRTTLIITIAIIVLIGVAQGSFEYRSIRMVAIGYLALAFLFGALLVLALNPGSWTSRIFSSPILRFYGSISYGFYVFHELIHDWTRPIYVYYAGVLHSPTAGGVLYIVTIFALVTGAAFLSFKYFETPFLQLKNRFQYQTRSVPVEATQVVTG